MTHYHQIIPEGPMQKNPVLVILNGLAAALSLVLVATNVTGVTHLDAAQTTAVVAAVAAVCNLVALAIRASVVSPATNAEQVAVALATPTTSDAVNNVTIVQGKPTTPGELQRQVTEALRRNQNPADGR